MTSAVVGSDKNREMERMLLDVVQALHDSQRGFLEVGERLEDEVLKRYFLAESLKRARFRAELEGELHRSGLADVEETGTMFGAFLRAWGGMKVMLGGGDPTLLATAAQGEDETKRAYQDALERELPYPVRTLLASQQAHIAMAYDYIRTHIEKLAA